MQHDPRPHIRRRADALETHRSLRTTAAIAGVAATAAFSLMAAMTWSGDPGATPLPATGTTSTSGDDGTTTVRPTAPTRNRTQTTTNGGFAQPPTVTTPRSNRSGGHASTGGSH
jgi:hypothetical protein